MSQSNRFNYSNKQRYVNNQHIIRKLNTRTIYKKEDYYKDNKKEDYYKDNNHRTIIPTNIDKPSKLKISPSFKSKLNCSICLECINKSKSNSSTLKCNHIFHLGCINEWSKVSKTCPICRAVIIIPGKDIQYIRIYLKIRTYLHGYYYAYIDSPFQRVII